MNLRSWLLLTHLNLGLLVLQSLSKHFWIDNLTIFSVFILLRILLHNRSYVSSLLSYTDAFQMIEVSIKFLHRLFIPFISQLICKVNRCINAWRIRIKRIANFTELVIFHLVKLLILLIYWLLLRFEMTVTRVEKWVSVRLWLMMRIVHEWFINVFYSISSLYLRKMT